MSAPTSTTGNRSQEPDARSTSWLNIFSPSAVAKLPKAPWNLPDRSIRADHIPEDGDDENDSHRDYNAINRVRVPKKVATPIKVEGKVWFANERSEIFALLQ